MAFFSVFLSAIRLPLGFCRSIIDGFRICVSGGLAKESQVITGGRVSGPICENPRIGAGGRTAWGSKRAPRVSTVFRKEGPRRSAAPSN